MNGTACRSIMRILCRLSTWFLGIAGVLSAGCDSLAEPTYGPPGTILTVTGKVFSAVDSSAVQGILISVLNNDSVEVGLQSFTDQNGEYFVYIENFEDALEDSLEISAMDIDGAENGEFFDADTVLALPPGDDPEVTANFVLQPKGGS